MNKVREDLDSWFFWQEARAWAKDMHPSWEWMATQKHNPELREQYRTKILNEYIAYNCILANKEFGKSNK